MKIRLFIQLMVLVTVFTACDNDDNKMEMGQDPATAEKAVIDRFSEDAATLFVRNSTNGLPESNKPINFDEAPFITQGLSSDGHVVKYYNFDVQPLTSAPIFVLFREGESAPVDGQLNIINVIPGDAGYNDFWHVNKVNVPADYVANTITSYTEIIKKGYVIERTKQIVNCPVVPEGSTASLRYTTSESTELINGWYKGKLVSYFTFAEKALMVDLPDVGYPNVPLSDIFVTFNINPDQTGGGPVSGFLTEEASAQTHNVIETIPENTNYSPFWDVNVYNNMDFDQVHDWMSVKEAMIMAESVAKVNCPVVYAK